jgi:hypothetical protein
MRPTPRSTRPLPSWVALETPTRCACTGRLSIMLKTDAGWLEQSVLTDSVWNGKLAYRKDTMQSVGGLHATAPEYTGTSQPKPTVQANLEVLETDK